jgi:hypothetical protein
VHTVRRMPETRAFGQGFTHPKESQCSAT